MNICLFVGILSMALLGLATASSMQGTWPEMIFGAISKGVILWSVLGVLAVGAIATGVVGIMKGKN
ncbi:MAG: hypothetical protein IPK83_02410 [Planctomycetes bacterium]|nr:hypothetical protein [Planctomycetota bacterium]